MKAKMFRSVDIEEVPAELQIQLREVTDAIGKACESNTTTTHVMNLDMKIPANIDCVMQSIHNTRLLLSQIDKELTDVANVLTGFLGHVSKEAEKAEKSRLLEQAMQDKQRQQAKPLPVAEDYDEIAGPDVEESSISKEFMKKIAEMSNVNKG